MMTIIYCASYRTNCYITGHVFYLLPCKGKQAYTNIA